MKLISNKMMIPSDVPLTSRQRLLDVIPESLTAGSSTGISGRAGTGKTMLAMEFARRCGRKVAWYKVDAPEISLSVFLKYLVACVARENPGFGDKTGSHSH